MINTEEVDFFAPPPLGPPGGVVGGRHLYKRNKVGGRPIKVYIGVKSLRRTVFELWLEQNYGITESRTDSQL